MAVLFAMAAGTAATLPTSTLSGIETLPKRLLAGAEDLAHRAPDRILKWLEGQTGAVGDRLATMDGDSGGAVVERPRERPPVRIIRGSPTASRPALFGSARVVDGDTLELAGVRVRLHGIDAPESGQSCRAGGRPWPCGREAARALARRIAGEPVTCPERDRDVYGRVVAVCTVGGQDLNRWMVAEGWAFAYRRYSRAYVAAESRARAARRGIWRGEVVAPWEWRRGKRLSGSRAPAARRDGGRCRIKGNIGRDGRRIYHVPGGQYYDRTRIDTSRGERWFCSESAARAAGWRRSRR